VGIGRLESKIANATIRNDSRLMQNAEVARPRVTAETLVELRQVPQIAGD